MTTMMKSRFKSKLPIPQRQIHPVYLQYDNGILML
jgi:hypothetical protein